MVANILLFIVALTASGSFFYFTCMHKQKKTMALLWQDNKYEMALSATFLIGFLVRLMSIATMPAGLNQDEASLGYDAYAILKYGVDRNGKSLPIHLIAWGSGQNALYAYLVMPFVLIGGLNEFTLRLPMALVGCVSLVAFYVFLKNTTGRKETLIGTLLFAIMPWHILKSRWGLESNLFPDMILWFIVLFVLGYKNQRKSCYWWAFGVLGLSVYAYGTAYFFVPLFLGILLVFMLIKKMISWKDILAPSIMLFVIVLPMILFVMVNTFDMQEIKIGALTIPKLYVSRHTDKSAIFSKNFFKTFYENFTNSFDILLSESDGLPWNSIAPYGLFYGFGFIFMVIGIVVCASKAEWVQNKFLINIFGIVSLLMMGIVEPNINRLNVIWICAFIYIVIGVCACVRHSKLLMKSVAVAYFALFIMFSHTYLTDYQDQIGHYFFESFGSALCDASERDAEVIYVTDSVNQPYIFALWYSKTSPIEYRETVKFNSQFTAFESVHSFGKYVFHIPNNLNDPNAVYVMPLDQAKNLNKDIYDITEYKRYCVVELR